jgi:DNA-binding LacI/PurR family transcriptional regulator
MSISAKELAAKLNISAATVSMVLNNKPGISPATRTLVLDAAKQYGYEFTKKMEDNEPHPVIHFIIYKKNGSIVTDTPFFNQIIEGINIQCQKYQCRQQITYVYENPSIQSRINEIYKLECTGIILLATEMSPEDYKYFAKLEVPIVVLDNYFEEILYDTVSINNTQGAYLATKYLYQKGHTKIGYLHSKMEIGNFKERKDGYIKALSNYHLMDSQKYMYTVSPTMEEAYEDIKHYLSYSPELATAYFADNDIIAVAALRAFKEQGFSIPDEISVIGFDDMPVCTLTEPPLTTMSVPKLQLGELAVERLMQKINKTAHETIKIEVATTLIERKSVKNSSVY